MIILLPKLKIYIITVVLSCTLHHPEHPFPPAFFAVGTSLIKLAPTSIYQIGKIYLTQGILLHFRHGYTKRTWPMLHTQFPECLNPYACASRG
jgi:hypothetical protein